MTTETQEESEIDTKQPREDQNGIFLGHTIFAAVRSAYVEKIRARLVDYYYYPFRFIRLMPILSSSL